MIPLLRRQPDAPRQPDPAIRTFVRVLEGLEGRAPAPRGKPGRAGLPGPPPTARRDAEPGCTP